MFMMNTERPFDMLSKALGQQVLIRMKGSMVIRGRLRCFDMHMNLALEGAEELEAGELKAKIGTIVLRGGNIIFVSPI
jgi:small nuclear ribonucleoprotein